MKKPKIEPAAIPRFLMPAALPAERRPGCRRVGRRAAARSPAGASGVEHISPRVAPRQVGKSNKLTGFFLESRPRLCYLVAQEDISALVGPSTGEFGGRRGNLAWHALTNDDRKTKFPRRETRTANISQSKFAPKAANDLRRKMRGWLRLRPPVLPTKIREEPIFKGFHVA